MSDYTTTCWNCGRYIALDEHFEEERNDYGYPVAICDDCNGLHLTKTYVRLPNCS